MKRELCSAKEFYKPKMGIAKESLVLVIFCFFIILFHYTVKGDISRTNPPYIINIEHVTIKRV